MPFIPSALKRYRGGKGQVLCTVRSGSLRTALSARELLRGARNVAGDTTTCRTLQGDLRTWRRRRLVRMAHDRAGAGRTGEVRSGPVSRNQVQGLRGVKRRGT